MDFLDPTFAIGDASSAVGWGTLHHTSHAYHQVANNEQNVISSRRSQTQDDYARPGCLVRCIAAFGEALVRKLGVMHETNRGHTEEINMVSANKDLSLIASASEDQTARIWYLDRNSGIGNTYRLLRVLHHSSEVRAVEFLENENAILTGTSVGDVFLWVIKDDVLKQRSVPSKLHEGVHGQAITGFSSAKKGPCEWHVVIGCADGHAFLLEVVSDSKQQRWELKYLHSLLHEGLGPVLSVTHIVGHDDKEGATFASCVASGVHLWNMQGELVTKLKIGSSSSLTGLAISADSSLLYASSTIDEAGKISVWGLVDGHLVDRDGKTLPMEKGMELAPLVEYDRTVEKFALGMEDTLITSRPDGSCVFFALRPDPGEEAVGTNGPAKVLGTKDTENIVRVVRHLHPVTAVRCLKDPDEDQVLCTGTKDGSVHLWDLSGHNKGELMAHMRSLTVFEIMGPLLEKLIICLQLSAFAFGEHMQWKPVVSTSAFYVTELACFDFHILFTLDKEMIFWPKTLAVLAVMGIFVLSALIGGVDRINRFTAWIQGHKRYQDEKRATQAGKTRSGLMHTLLWIARKMRTFWTLFIKLISLLLVVPITKTLVLATHCVPMDEVIVASRMLAANTSDATITSTQKLYLGVAPSVQCFTGTHLKLMYVLLPLSVVFSFMLLPFAVVGGDASYVQREDIFDFHAWHHNADRKVSSVFMGSLHKDINTNFRLDILELMVKIAIPIAAISSRPHQVLEMSCLSAIAFVNFAASLLWNGYLDARFTNVVRGMKTLTLCIMLSGLYTAILEDHARLEPLVCLCLSLILVPLLTTCMVRRSKSLASLATYRHVARADVCKDEASLRQSLTMESS